MFWQNVHELDQQITLAINSWNSSITDIIWMFFSNKYVWIPMYAAIVAFIIYRLGWKKGLIIVCGALLTFGFCDQFSNLIKDSVARIRPLHDEFMIASGIHVLEQGGGFSFFSAHAANAFGLASATYFGLLQDKRHKYTVYGTLMFVWAALVAISRVFVGRHYLGDILAGTLIGLVAGYAFAQLMTWICRKYIRKDS